MDHNVKSNLENFDIYTESPNIDCYVSMAEMLRPNQKKKKRHLSTITLGCLHTKRGSLKVKHQKIISSLRSVSVYLRTHLCTRYIRYTYFHFLRT